MEQEWIKKIVPQTVDPLIMLIGDEQVHLATLFEKVAEEATRRGIQQGKREALEDTTNRVLEELEAVKGLNKINPKTHHQEYLQGIFQAYRILKSKLSSLDNSSKE